MNRHHELVKVLVVDDVPQNLIAMHALLQRPGLEVLTATSGTEALELLLAHEVALALVDVQMPEMDGFALAELMRGAQRTREVPIIFLTASPTDPGRTFRGYEAGAVDFLHKPVDPMVIASKVAVFVELYQQRQLLKERNDALEQLLKLNETMVAVLTHDLRTPLGAIMMCAEILRMQAGTDAAKRSVERIKSSGSRMARMIDQLLDFSRIRSGVLNLHSRLASLEEVCSAALAELRHSHPDATIELTHEGDLRGRFDTDRLIQVFSNLVGNAIQHGEPGAPIRVHLDGTDSQRLVASVTNGGQVPEGLLPNLFEAFRGDGERREGLGLGLYIVDQFVRAHGGEVQARNADGSAIFSFHLPRALSESLEL
jgi:signal transduction histidine kinase